MGTLFHQDPRRSYSVKTDELISFIDELKQVAKKTSVPLEQVLKAAEIKELERRNNLYCANGDAHDEQMSGFGELLDSMSANLERIAGSLDRD